jgi:SH3-like domain-containing protein
MDNKKKKKNKQQNFQYSESGTETLKKDDVDTDEIKSYVKVDAGAKSKDSKSKKQKTENVKIYKKAVEPVKEEKPEIEKDKTVENPEKSLEKILEKAQKKIPDKTILSSKNITSISPEQVRVIVINALKILLPVAACAVVIAVIFSYAGSKKNKELEEVSLDMEDKSEAAGTVTLTDEPLEENAHEDVNELMTAFYTAMAEGDMDTIKALKDYNDETEIIQYEKKSEFIESYDDINCYTKAGIEENSYFVYVSYDVKIKDVDTKAPGLNAFYVYTADDGNLVIDGDMEESIIAAFKLVTNQDDVVDLYNKINVSYKEAIASDEALNGFMSELPSQIKTSVGEALAQLEIQNTESTETQKETEDDAQTSEAAVTDNSEDTPQNQVVNQTVKATDTVNVRSSDSEEADKIGKVTEGQELTRVEEKVNGWSKVIFEGKEAYIKSDYLEVVTTEAVGEKIGSVEANTNVNVRSKADQESDKLGTAQAGNSYDLLEEQGEWYKINYNGKTGYVKAEFFEKE